MEGKKIGMFGDPAGDVSSKRVQSFIGLAYALILPVLNGTFSWTGVPVAEICAMFLTYSAAMQGVSALAEKGMP